MLSNQGKFPTSPLWHWFIVSWTRWHTSTFPVKLALWECCKTSLCCTINSLLLTCVISLFLEVRLDNFPTTHKGSNHPRVPSDHERSSKWKRFVRTWRKALFMFLLSGLQFVSQFITYILQIINRLPHPRHYSNKLAIMLVWQNSFSESQNFCSPPNEYSEQQDRLLIHLIDLISFL